MILSFGASCWSSLARTGEPHSSPSLGQWCRKTPGIRGTASLHPFPSFLQPAVSLSGTLSPLSVPGLYNLGMVLGSNQAFYRVNCSVRYEGELPSSLLPCVTHHWSTRYGGEGWQQLSFLHHTLGASRGPQAHIQAPSSQSSLMPRGG